MIDRCLPHLAASDGIGPRTNSARQFFIQQQKHYEFFSSQWNSIIEYLKPHRQQLYRLFFRGHFSIPKSIMRYSNPPTTVSKNVSTGLKFVKKFTRPNFRVKEFYTLKTRKSRLFSPAMNSKNASITVIWPSFG